MIKQLCCVIFLFLASCTCPGIIGDAMTDQDFVTVHGLNIHPQGNWVSQDEIERATEMFTLDVASFLPCQYAEEHIREIYLQNIHIYVEEDEFQCRLKQGYTYCKGTYKGGEIHYVNEDCIGDSAFVHEMLHLLNARIEGFHDHHHIKIRFWGDNDHSLEHIINENIKEHYCPSCW